jgi:hypothetical protein
LEFANSQRFRRRCDKTVNWYDFRFSSVFLSPGWSCNPPLGGGGEGGGLRSD